MNLDTDMAEVTPGLYVGMASAARNTIKLQQHNITHILTVDCFPLPEDCAKPFKTMFIQAHDDLAQDLLSYFPHANKFISDAIGGDVAEASGGGGETRGKVLVHCAMGMSRSATLACAYIMNRYDSTAQHTLRRVRERRHINPNINFLEQLRAYEKLGHQIDDRDENFRRYRLLNFAAKMSGGGMVPKHFPVYFYAKNPWEDNLAAPDIVKYKCVDCGQVLFTSVNVLAHKVGVGESGSSWRQYLQALTAGSPHDGEAGACPGGVECLYLEPVLWMNGADLGGSITAGSLMCPNASCRRRVGSFDWRGETCAECEARVTPAFRVNAKQICKS